MPMMFWDYGPTSPRRPAVVVGRPKRDKAKAKAQRQARRRSR